MDKRESKQGLIKPVEKVYLYIITLVFRNQVRKLYEESRQMQRNNLVICVDGAYSKNNKILLLKRAEEPFKGYWGLVGGKVEIGETLPEALKREFKEETDLDIEVGNLLDVRFENTFDRTKKIFTFEVTNARGTIKLSPESESYCWFDTIPNNSVYDYEKFLSRKKPHTQSQK